MIVVETTSGNVLRLRCSRCKEFASLMGSATTRRNFEKQFRKQHAHDDSSEAAEVSPSSDGEGRDE